jgi:hypothetical protein
LLGHLPKWRSILGVVRLPVPLVPSPAVAVAVDVPPVKAPAALWRICCTNVKNALTGLFICVRRLWRES